MSAVGASWAVVQAVLLTHTHSDHWNDATLGHLFRRRIPLYCHPGHHRVLTSYSRLFGPLHMAGLVREYQEDAEVRLAPGLSFRPISVRHDGGPTFGFRLWGAPDLFGHAPAIGYIADLGTWDPALVSAMAGVELLALEFNHDEDLERFSGRQEALIARVLGDEGHLSNTQAAEFVGEVLARSPGQLRYLVQLHLSRDCNRISLAVDAARSVLQQHNSLCVLHTASQDEPLPTIDLGVPAGPSRRRSPARRRRGATPSHPWLPGFDAEQSPLT
jgi:ribonuclease BN (tRNA processing enzyme)